MNLCLILYWQKILTNLKKLVKNISKKKSLLDFI